MSDNFKKSIIYFYLPLIVFMFLMLALFVFFPLPGNCASLDNLENQEVNLNKDYNSILDYQYTFICEKEFCSTEELTEVLEYLYISDNPVEYQPYEILEERTANTRVFNSGTDQKTYRVYSGQPFIEVENNWYYTETNFVYPEIWTSQQISELSLLEKINKLNPFRIYKVNADIYYSGVGDGHVIYDNAANWDTAHDATAGTSYDYTSSLAYVYAGIDGSSQPYIYRDFIPLDTSAFSGTVSTSSLFIYVDYSAGYHNDDNDGEDYVALVQTSQASPTVLANADFDTCGAVNSPVIGSDTIDISSISGSGYIEFTLNSTGISWINDSGYTLLGMREGHDILDNPISGSSQANSFRWFTSEYTGTANDPYLEITIGEEEEEEEETIYATECIPENINDISVISGCSYTASTTGATYFIYHIPFFVWLFFWFIISFMFGRIILEFIIALRKK